MKYAPLAFQIPNTMTVYLPIVDVFVFSKLQVQAPVLSLYWRKRVRL